MSLFACGVRTVGVLLLTVRIAAAQELEARAYSPAPIGTTFLLGGFGRSEGGILFDPPAYSESLRSPGALLPAKCTTRRSDRD